ncbi:MAG: histidine phosphatase family protein [Pseudomonadales bacterium]
MKRLTVIRHGEAGAPPQGKTDFERPLNQSGLQEARSIALQLKQDDFNFDQLFCSTAQRTLTTAQIIHQAFEPNNRPLLTDQALYNFDIEPFYRFIEMIDDDIQHAVIVAHNPGLSYLVNDLLRAPVRSMSTCTVIQMQLNIEQWVDIQSRCAQLLTIHTPI